MLDHSTFLFRRVGQIWRMSARYPDPEILGEFSTICGIFLAFDQKTVIYDEKIV
jgi:hypothetical protein